MYIEVSYISQQGSICPFCGTTYNPVQRTKLEYIKTDTREGSFDWMDCDFCNMPSLALSLLIQTEEAPGYKFHTRQFMFKDDYEEYFGIQVDEGPYEVPVHYEEDMVCLAAITADTPGSIRGFFNDMKKGLTNGYKQPYRYGLYADYTGTNFWRKEWKKPSLRSPKGKRSTERILKRSGKIRAA